jgi:hypothetical protein
MTSAQEITPTNLTANVRRVLALWLRKSSALAVLNFNILSRPTWTGANVVTDGNAGLLRAIKYYSKMFALAFAIGVIANRFQLYEGRSEWRFLIQYILQLLVAIPIIYVLCLALPDRIPLRRLIQAALYVDGAYIVAEAVASIPLSYLTLVVPSGNREIDIIATEYERCLWNNSIFYRLLRGDLKYFLYSDAWKPQVANLVFANFHYVVVAPFLPIFAFMLRPTRKISFILICLITPIAFVTVMEGADFIKRRLGDLLAVQDTKCTFGFLDQVTKNYAPDLVAQQVTYKINNDGLKNSYTYFSSFVVHGTSLVMPFKLNPGVDKGRVLEQIPPAVRQVYCDDIDPYWVLVRRINYNLPLVMYDNDDTLLHQQRFTPKDCPG